MTKDHYSLKPIFVIIITVFGALTGMLGSVYADHIANAFPLSIPTENYTWCWAAFFFWFLLLLTGLGVGVRANHASKKFTATTERLAGLVTTMPANGFMNLYRKEFKDSHSLLLRSELEAKKLKLDSNNLHQNIRAVFDSILNIVRFFENRHQEPIYGINIMLYAKFSTIEKNFGHKDNKQTVSEYLQSKGFTPLFFGATGIENLEGMLILDNALSTRSDIGNIPDDSLLDLMSFPLFKPLNINGKINTLPGAPYAFKDDFYYLCSDVDLLEQWIKEHCHYETQVLEELTNYFQSDEGQNIKSFLSFRIELDGQKYGVVNIHSNEKHLISSGTLDSEIFIPCLEPFVAMLGRLIKLQKFTIEA